jgi:phosphatidylserine decarboxylase
MIIKTVIVFTIFIILFVLFFNRHPEINIGKINNNEVLSPSYGTIKKIIKSNNRITIIIFLSPLDIHVQYYPIYGKVISQVHDLNGKYELAYKLNKSNENEKVITTIKPTIDIPNIIIKQIAGFFVRRITTVIENIPKEGLPVKPANKLGMIKLGSRVDLELPSNDFILLVKENQKVYGPYTKIGYYKTKLTLGKNEVNLR